MTTAQLTWQVLFDWDNDGSFAYNEAARVTAVAIERGRAGDFANFEAGKCTLTLENYDRRFDPWYASSPLYPNVQPRRGVQIRAMAAVALGVNANDELGVNDDDELDVSTGTYWSLFKGKIEDIEPTGSIGNRSVLVTAYDGLRDLAAQDVPATLRESVKTDAAITAVLDAAGWPAGERDLDTGDDTLGYWWMPGGESAKKNIDDLALSEFGAFFMSGAGLATFYNRRNYNTSAATGTLDQAYMADVLLKQPWEGIYNLVTVRCNPLRVNSSAVLWTLQDSTVYVEPGASVELWAEYADANGTACAGDDVISPVVTTDYTANTTQGGGGTDMTTSMSVAVNIYSTWAKLTVSNSSAVSGFYITLLQIRGKSITPLTTPVRRERSASQATYGTHSLTLDVPWQQSVETSGDLATVLINFYADPKPPMTVLLDNLLPECLRYELCDRLGITLAEYTIDQTMRVNSLSLRTGRTMQDVKLTLGLSPADDTVYWLLGVAGVSELGVTTLLGY